MFLKNVNYLRQVDGSSEPSSQSSWPSHLHSEGRQPPTSHLNSSFRQLLGGRDAVIEKRLTIPVVNEIYALYMCCPVHCLCAQTMNNKLTFISFICLCSGHAELMYESCLDYLKLLRRLQKCILYENNTLQIFKNLLTMGVNDAIDWRLELNSEHFKNNRNN